MMKNKFKIFGAALMVAGLLTTNIQAEWGIGVGSASTYEVEVGYKSTLQLFANDPGDAIAGIDHEYDDGYNRVDSTGNSGGITWYWGYDNASQWFNASDSVLDTITMNSARTTVQTGSSASGQNERETAVQVYWQTDSSKTNGWSFGLRAALNWQMIDFDDRAMIGTAVETISDTYVAPSTAWNAPPAPFEGDFSGPNSWLTDAPTRTISPASASVLVTRRTFDGDLFTLNIGPTAVVDLSEKVRFVGAIGGTIGWLDGDFSYNDDGMASGSDSDSEWIYGVYVSTDIQFQMGEHWGIFTGISFNKYDDVEFDVDGRSIDFEFEGHSIMGGIYYR